MNKCAFLDNSKRFAITAPWLCCDQKSISPILWLNIFHKWVSDCSFWWDIQTVPSSSSLGILLLGRFYVYRCHSVQYFAILFSCERSTLHSFYSFFTPPWQGSGVLRSVCLSVSPWAYLWNRWTDFHKILFANPLWPWLGPPLAALHYVMYFLFYGWHHVCP